MIFYQTIKYFILDTCLTTFFDKFQRNLKINLPPMTIPLVGSFYKEINGPSGEHYKYMICRQIIHSSDLHFKNWDMIDDEFLYMFSKEGNSQYDNGVVFIELIITESKLSNWILIP